MSFSDIFIRRPIATTLLTAGVALAGVIGFTLLPVSPLPQVDFPTVSVQASLPGASPETMAATVATPLERSLGKIAGVTEMTSSSSLGSARVTLQFDLSRDIDGAARDVQAAINAARVLLPTSLPSNPTYRKVNPADAPIMIIALTSEVMSRGQMYDAAATVLAQTLSQVDGVGQVVVSGSALPAVRVEVNMPRMNQMGLAFETVRNAIANSNANRPKGAIETETRRWQIQANDQAQTAAEFAPLIVGYKNGGAIRLSDIAQVVDSVQDLRNDGSVNGKPAVMLIVTRQPGANILETVDRIKALLPQLAQTIPRTIDLQVAMERTTTIRASLHEVERALLISIALVIMVVFLFLRSGRATFIPAVAVPVSLCGTFAVMYLAGFSLNNLSLMALTVATGFVVDDAIVVLENISRHIEEGMKPMRAAIIGAREVGFTVVSMSVSLIAVFVPILAMGGIVGRLFREFAVTLSAAILVSLVISLTTTPMMCARLPARKKEGQGGKPPGRFARWSEAALGGMHRGYARTLRFALDYSVITLLILAGTIALNVYLFTIVPKGFFPTQDTGMMTGGVQADQSTSFQSMQLKLKAFIEIVKADPAVSTVAGFTGGGQRNSAFLYVVLKPLKERNYMSSMDVVARMRPKLSKVPGAALFLQPVQDIRIGGRSSNATYQFTLQGDDLNELRDWEPKVRAALSRLPELTDVNTDAADKGLQSSVVFNRDAASRLGLNPSSIDAVLNDAFGQRQVSTIYAPLNQYRVVMEAAPEFWQSPNTLNQVYIPAPGSSSGVVPLSTVATFTSTNTSLGVNHQGQFAASTVSFNLAPKVSLGEASAAINDAMARAGVPNSVRGTFQGSAKAFQDSLSSQPMLILAALITIYIVLGVLYESTVHPITIISTLPSAGVGAVLALILTGTEFNIIGLIGVILLIGIVKKNAIMMIDVAITAERERGLDPREAIYEACLLRLRPIMMTTLAALLGALPLALGSGDGAELRRPLGISIVGGLILSQLLTLYTTPVVYLALDRARLRMSGWYGHLRGRPVGSTI
ncbi:MAG: multidrug transporter subunit MdtC [Betaproteobacteria bacterium]|nr:multidrug transporter subunit MdtC [Betaproteobacteria bacterium]